MPIRDEDMSEYRFARTPPHLSAAPDLPKQPAPGLSENTREILEQLLGYESGQVDDLMDAGVVTE